MPRWMSLCVFLTACSSATPQPTDGGADAPPTDIPAAVDAPTVDAPVADAPARDVTSPAAACASEFGRALTPGFSRLDGVVTAVVTPADTQCPMPNSTHVVVQVRMGGAVYRLVVNINSTRAGVDPRVRVADVRAPLPLPAWEEGWHVNQQLDYVVSLGLHTDAFMFRAPDALAQFLAATVPVGERVSVYATNGASQPDSAHLIHRNGNGEDGAIVIDPTGASPRWLLFHFDGQTF